MTHPSRKDLDRVFDSFDCDFVTPSPVDHPNVKKAIELLEEIEDFDGETMEHIITSLFMREQMLKQLMNTCEWRHVSGYYDERQELIDTENARKNREYDEAMSRGGTRIFKYPQEEGW